MKDRSAALRFYSRAACCSFVLINFFFSLAACTDCGKKFYRYADGEICLEMLSDSVSILRHIRRGGDEPFSIFRNLRRSRGECVSEFVLPYPTFRLSCGDLDEDGIPEIGVGVIKSTRYSPVADKRLFLFHLTGGVDIRPLWLGTHVGGLLDDFSIGGDALIHTVEHNAADSTFHRTYKLSSFGIKPVAL